MSEVKAGKMGRACRTYWGDEKCKIRFDEKKRPEENTWEIWKWIRK